jgi:outer membrane protein assembly factor BamB
MISVGAKSLYSYDPSNGEELWKVYHRGWSIFPRPGYGNGLIFATIDSDRPALWVLSAQRSCRHDLSHSCESQLLQRA